MTMTSQSTCGRYLRKSLRAIGIFFIPAIFYFVEKLAGATRPERVPSVVDKPAGRQLT